MAQGGIRMRILLIAVILFAVIHFIRIDFTEGTIPMAAFLDKQAPCEEGIGSIPVTTVEGDTIESLFALYPDPEIDLIERLSVFYSLNPHLQKQKIVENEIVRLPLSNLNKNECGK